MKNILCSTLTFFLIHSCWSQNALTCIDDASGKPIQSVYVYNCKNELLGITNEKGIIHFSNPCFPIKTKQFEYEDLVLKSISDTIRLKYKFRMIDEVKVTPINKMDLYNRIIENSNKEVDRSQSIQYGRFFQALMIIEQNSTDTVFIDRSALMAIERVPNKKNLNYSIYLSEAQQSFDGFNSEKNIKDTAVIQNLLKLLPKFDENLKYDLTNVSKFKLDYEENEITRTIGMIESLQFKNLKKEFEKLNSAYYRDSILLKWIHNSYSKKVYEGQSVYINFDKHQRTFEYDTTHYRLNSILNEVTLSLNSSDKFLKILVVQGFIEMPELKFDSLGPSVKVEDYFSSLKYTIGTPRYYKFE